VNARIIIVDDHPLFRGAAAAALAPRFEDAAILEVGTFEGLHQVLDHDTNVDLILLDLSLPDADGLFGLLHVRARYPEIPVAIISGIDDARIIHRAIECGAAGYIPKTQTVETLRDAVCQIIAGQIWQPAVDALAMEIKPEDTGLAARFTRLTAQQLRVLGLLCKGMLNRQMAQMLGITEATAKAHVSDILHKLGAHSRTQAVIFAFQLNSVTNN